MAKRPPNVEWSGFTAEQRKLLDRIDFIGNNAWSRNGQTEAMMPGLLKDAADEGLTIAAIVGAMHSVGYEERATHELERWERKRLTGKFGR